MRSPTTSGRSDVARSATACNGPESPSPSGTRAPRCKPFWRRCGHSGVTPGTRAPDHRRRSARRARQERRLRRVGRRAGSRVRDSDAGRSVRPAHDRPLFAGRRNPRAVVINAGGYVATAKASRGRRLGGGDRRAAARLRRAGLLVDRPGQPRPGRSLARRRTRRHAGDACGCGAARNFVLLAAAAVSSSAGVLIERSGSLPLCAAVAVVLRLVRSSARRSARSRRSIRQAVVTVVVRFSAWPFVDERRLDTVGVALDRLNFPVKVTD